MKDYNKAIELDPSSVTPHINSSEVMIASGCYEIGLNTLRRALSLPMTTEERAVSLYLECIANKLLKNDVSECEKAFNEVLKEEFTSMWSFVVLESWVADADISANVKRFIIEKTELLKKHKTPSRG